MEESQVLSLFVQKPGKNCINDPELVVLVGLFDKVRHTWEGCHDGDFDYPLSNFQIEARVYFWNGKADVSLNYEHCVRPYCLSNSRDAERVTRLLRKIENGLFKIRHEFGECASFGAYVVRVAKVLGVKVLVFADEKYDAVPSRSGLPWTQDVYYHHKVADAVGKIDRYISEMKGEV